MISEYKETFDNYNNFEEFYYPSVCHVCKVKNKSLKTCKSCKAYRYCTVAHQRTHWPSHKKICKILNSNLKKSEQNNFNGSLKSSLHVRIQVKILLEQGLARPLMPAENQVWMFPRACPVCKVTADVMVDCPHCPSVNYCSAEHQLQHKHVHSKLCGAMNLQYQVYCSRLNESSDVMLNRDVTFQEMLNIFSYIADGIPNIDIQLVRLADRLSHVLTIINALTICDVICDAKTSQNHLTIHIVGVTYECSNFNRLICELIFHWIGNLKTLNLVFIGPELADEWIPDWDYCQSCVDRNITITYSLEPTLYSQYRSSDRYKVPSIIAIFNCGFHELDNSEFDLWGESLPLLLIPDVPLILTSYTSSEAVQDLNRLKSIFQDSSLDLLRKCEKNPFCSPVPLRDWINPEEIYFNNFYFSLIKKKM